MNVEQISRDFIGIFKKNRWNEVKSWRLSRILLGYSRNFMKKVDSWCSSRQFKRILLNFRLFLNNFRLNWHDKHEKIMIDVRCFIFVPLQSKLIFCHFLLILESFRKMSSMFAILNGISTIVDWFVQVTINVFGFWSVVMQFQSSFVWFRVNFQTTLVNFPVSKQFWRSFLLIFPI